ncbi:MAG: FAD:protein FMN transferase [Bryobacterales bacterium]|nr:FAD:protein FMN transferase [Bryobacterales bacterium]
MIAAPKGFVLRLWLASALLGLAPGWAAEPLRIESSLDAMGTTFTVVAYGESRVQLETAVDLAFEEVRRINELISNYLPRSEWSQVNREAANRAVRVSPELFDFLKTCLEYSRQSGGTFDITVGPLVRVWGFYKGTGRLPHRAEIRGALARVGYQKVLLDEANQSVRFTRTGVEIDPGGIGKGYAVDRVVEILKERGIRSALISAGGSSIYGLGAPPGEAGWPVKIRHPRTPKQTVADLVLRDLSMSTSGTSEKFFVAGGKIYSHVFDPRTGYPAQGVLSVSVTAPRTIDSEAWTKPYFIQGKRPVAGAPKSLKVFLCEDKAELACAWLR